jgi:uncharacterized RDD family membrane protein YckC
MKKNKIVDAPIDIIDTPIEFATPSFARIVAAMVYDTLLLAAISIAYSALIVALRVWILGAPQAGQHIAWGMMLGSLITLGWLVLLMSFYIYFWHKFGQTLGMKTWRFQLVDAQTNQLASYSKCIKRSAIALFSLAFFGIGYWCRFVHPQQRLLHDVLSDTKLILLKKTQKNQS